MKTIRPLFGFAFGVYGTSLLIAYVIWFHFGLGTEGLRNPQALFWFMLLMIIVGSFLVVLLFGSAFYVVSRLTQRDCSHDSAIIMAIVGTLFPCVFVLLTLLLPDPGISIYIVMLAAFIGGGALGAMKREPQ